MEDVYEARVAPNDANIGLAEMMKAVEIKYRNYVLRLDTLPQEQVVRAETECFADYERVMRIAQEAAKRVVQIERLTHRLKRALEPPMYRTTRGKKCMYFAHETEETTLYYLQSCLLLYNKVTSLISTLLRDSR